MNDYLKPENIGTSIVKSIANSGIKEICCDLTEVGIDFLLKDSITKDIPIIGIITNLCSAGLTIRGIIFENKLIRFLLELENIPQQKRIDFVANIQQDKKFEKKVGEHLLLILDRIDDLDKAKILAKLFSAFIESTIDYTLFLRLSSILDKLFLPDLLKLYEYRNGMRYDEDTSENLYSLGLIYMALISGGSVEDGHGSKYAIRPLGNKLLDILDKY